MLRVSLFAGSLAALPLALPAPAVSSVLTVDDDGPADYTSIAAAVAAAADGDTILVAPGSYGPFVVQGKSLDVIARVPSMAHVSGGGISVRQAPAGGHVLLRGFVVTGTPEEALSVLNCQGEVVVEDCWLEGSAGVGLFVQDSHPDGYAAVRVESASAAFLRCTVKGGSGAHYTPLVSVNGAGGSGMRVVDGFATVHGGSFLGGPGGHVADDDAAWTGGHGGHGIELFGASVYVAGAGLFGGPGGIGGEDFDPFFGHQCGQGGDGGSGVGSVGPLIVGVEFLDVAVTPGLAGLGYSGCPSGQPGQATKLTAGIVTTIPAAALAFEAEGPVADTATLTLELEGPAGAPAVLGVSLDPALLGLPILAGPLLVDPLAIVVLPVGTLPAGPLTLTVQTLPDLPPGTALVLFAQGVYVDPGTGLIVPGAASAAVVLDAAL